MTTRFVLLNLKNNIMNNYWGKGPESEDELVYPYWFQEEEDDDEPEIYPEF